MYQPNFLGLTHSSETVIITTLYTTEDRCPRRKISSRTLSDRREIVTDMNDITGSHFKPSHQFCQVTGIPNSSLRRWNHRSLIKYWHGFPRPLNFSFPLSYFFTTERHNQRYHWHLNKNYSILNREFD